MKTRSSNAIFSAALVPQYAGTAFAADTWAVGAAATPIGQFIFNVGGFLSDIILPLLFTIAVLFFLFNMAKYFIIGGASDGERDKAKRNAIYSVAAFVFMLLLWALVNVGLSAIGDATGNKSNMINGSNNQSACPDYYRFFGKSCNVESSNTFNSGATFATNSGTSQGSGFVSTSNSGSGAGTVSTYPVTTSPGQNGNPTTPGNATNNSSNTTALDTYQSTCFSDAQKFINSVMAFSASQQCNAVYQNTEIGNLILIEKNGKVNITSLGNSSLESADFSNTEVTDALTKTAFPVDTVCLAHTHPLHNQYALFHRIDAVTLATMRASRSSVHAPPSLPDLGTQNLQTLLESHGITNPIVGVVYDGVGAWVTRDLKPAERAHFPEIVRFDADLAASKQALYGSNGVVLGGSMGQYLNNLPPANIDELYGLVAHVYPGSTTNLTKKESIWRYFYNLTGIDSDDRVRFFTAYDYLKSDTTFHDYAIVEKQLYGTTLLARNIDTLKAVIAKKSLAGTVQQSDLYEQYLNYAYLGKLTYFLPHDRLLLQSACADPGSFW